MRKNLNLENSNILIHVGNLRPEKNHLFLLKVFVEVKKKTQNATLLLIGADNMNGEIQNVTKALGIYEDVNFLGSRSDVHELLQAGDVFVFPSFYEGFPGAVLEAEAAGLPCLISDTITDEVIVTTNVKKLSIDVSPELWAEQILSVKEVKRNDGADAIIKSGYDVDSTADRMLDFYLSSSSKY